MKASSLKITFSTLLFSGCALISQAQKVTELQEVSITAPHAVKIDGKNFEWKPTDFSVSKRTSLSYIISNDEKNLYLVVKSTDMTNNAKIMMGGITFSVNPDGKKKEKESIALTYPSINRQGMMGGPGGGGARRGGMDMVRMGGAGGGWNTMTQKQRDSAGTARIKTQLATAKEIKLKGFKKTTDTLVSIYNTSGIKAFASIDNDNVYFYEVAIPLEELGITPTSTQEFAYNIKLNGLVMPGFDGPGGGGGGFGGGGNRGGGGGGGNRGGGFGGGGGRGGIDFQAMMSPTDFWGKYTLSQAKPQ